jgi:hypothetical protein
MKMTGRVELLPTIMEEGEVGVARMVEGNNTGLRVVWYEVLESATQTVGEAGES